jgi:hypothetical protein
MDDSETHKLLKETFELSKDNNKMLKRLQSNMRWGRFIHSLYWIIIIGSAFGAYYFVQPYIDQLLQVYSGVQNIGDSIPTNILDTLKGL